jgi:RNA-directed DNA polymerase
MSSGSYFPPPVKAIEIPKKSGGTRILGIPTVLDRVAQMVTKFYLEPQLEPLFHLDSYGYRPGKSAADALAATRKRCWRYNWLLEFDIKGLFDNINHDLLIEQVSMHTNKPWIILYIKRWLKAPFQMADGTVNERTKGTPQGGVVRRAKLYHGLRIIRHSIHSECLYSDVHLWQRTCAKLRGQRGVKLNLTVPNR